MRTRLQESINKDKMTETEKIIKMIEIIKNTKEYISVQNFTEWCCQAGCYDTFRRSQLIFLKAIEENNNKYIKNRKTNIT